MRTIAILLACAAGALAQVLPPSPTDFEVFSLKVFSEPLSPVGSTNSAANSALATALNAWSARTSPDDFSSLEGFLDAHPDSPWALSVRVGLADAYYRSGRFTRALNYYQKAWIDGKDMTEAKRVADAAAAGYLGLLARVGRFSEMQALLNGAGNRTFEGSAGQQIEHEKTGLYEMLNVPGKSFKCGPIALGAIQKRKGVPLQEFAQYLQEVQSPQTGFNLYEVWQMSEHLGMRMQMAWRSPGSEIVTPAVVHWKINHYGALTGTEKGKFHVEDATFIQEFWPTAAAIDDEASGYFLIPAGPLPAAWRLVGEDEAKKVWGKGNTQGNDQRGTGEEDKSVGGKTCKGMPRASVHAMLVSLKITDIPVGYTPPAGPPVNFEVSYSQRDLAAVDNQPGLGQSWRMKWFSYVSYSPNDPSASVSVFPRGGGEQLYKGFSGSNNVSAMTWTTPTRLERSASSGQQTFVRTFPDGSKEYFEKSDGVPVTPGTLSKRAYLTRVVDPAGRTVTLGYDSKLRVVTLTDTFGKVTTITYVSDTSFRIHTVTDPYGRSATFSYNTQGKLESITDAIGMTSRFEYGTDIISKMITPYGNTTFSFGVEGRTRWLETTDPYGDKERVEYRDEWPGRGSSFGDPASAVPQAQSLLTFNAYLGARNTFYWDKKAYAEGAGDYSKAQVFHWLHSPYNTTGLTDRILESEKKPFSSRIWYNYIGSTDMVWNPGTTALPTRIARLVDAPNGGTETQITKREYNSVGNLVSEIDPVGREIVYQYAPNGVDLTDVWVAGTKVFSARDWDNHLPRTITNEAGQTTTVTYNSNGQPRTITDPQNGTTELIYDSAGQLKTLDGPLDNDTVTLTWDKGLVESVTEPDGYRVRFEYDALDRITKVSFPDGTSEVTTYDRLDVKERKDRAGRVTQYWHNKLGQLAAVRDPEGRWTSFEWCRCGDLRQIRDALGRVTKWKHDVESRVTEKIYPDSTREVYSYDLSSRLAAVTDALGQVRRLTYNLDNTLAREQFLNAINNTAGVTYRWDPLIRRLASAADGTGTTTFGYRPFGVAGGGKIESIDGPLADDTLTFGYDVLGRLTSQKINGVERSFKYDAGSRLTNETNPLGEFVSSYVDGSGRLKSTSAPNGLTTVLSYLPNAQGRRLSAIAHTGQGNATVSSFTYGYGADGSITRWTQNQPSDTVSPMATWNLNYDAADQLTGVFGDGVETQAFAYDAAGNRLSAQNGVSVKSYSFNTLNQLTGVSGGGKMRVSGSTSEPADVTVQNKAARMLDSTSFTAEASVVPGTNTIAIVAKDGNGNTRTNTYQVVVPSVGARTFEYDANGNLRSDGDRTYQWDAKNRLIAVTRGNDTYSWSYNAFDQRVSESKNGQMIKRWVWAGGNQPAEERDGAGNVAARFYPQGFQKISYSPFQSSNFYVTKDHLGSIREVLDASGSVVSSYKYDAWGKRTSRGPANLAPFGFTGHYEHEALGLVFTLYRAYDPETGRWLSRDPIEEKGGLNLYGYVLNQPVNAIDPLGLKLCWRWVHMTSFYTKYGSYKQDKKGNDLPLSFGDIAVGNYGAGPNSPVNGQLAPGQSDKPAYPRGSTITVYPSNSPWFSGRVSDWGSYNIKHPSVPVNGWIDIWKPDGETNPQSDDGWISFEVPDCKDCPPGSSG